jgi:hypothetical protein
MPVFSRVRNWVRGWYALPVALTLREGLTGAEGALDARVNCVARGRGKGYAARELDRVSELAAGLEPARGFVISGSHVIEFFAEH